MVSSAKVLRRFRAVLPWGDGEQGPIASRHRTMERGFNRLRFRTDNTGRPISGWDSLWERMHSWKAPLHGLRFSAGLPTHRSDARRNIPQAAAESRLLPIRRILPFCLSSQECRLLQRHGYDAVAAGDGTVIGFLCQSVFHLHPPRIILFLLACSRFACFMQHLRTDGGIGTRIAGRSAGGTACRATDREVRKKAPEREPSLAGNAGTDHDCFVSSESVMAAVSPAASATGRANTIPCAFCCIPICRYNACRT